MTTFNTNKAPFSNSKPDEMNNPTAHRRLATTIQTMWPNALPPTPQVVPVPCAQKGQSLLSEPQLAKALEKQKWNQRLDANLFAHITADPFIGNTNLEGNQTSNTSQFLSEFLPFLLEQKHLFTSAELQKFQALLASLQNNDAGPEEMTQKVAALKPGESFLMAGGWRGKSNCPGHAMIYEFFRRQDGEYDIYIYNTGAGTEYHPQVRTANKILIQRMIKFTGVSPHELDLPTKEQPKCESQFFSALYRCLNHIHANHEKTTAKHIYEGAFGHIAHKKEAVRDNLSFFATGQRAGTCSEQVLKPIVFRHLCGNNINTFKKIQFYKKFYSTIAFYQKNRYNLQDLSTTSDQNRYLLKTASTKLLRSAAKSYNPNSPDKSLLKTDELLPIKATLEELQTKILQIEADVQKERQKEIRCFGMMPSVTRSNHAKIQEIPTMPLPSPPTEVFSSPPVRFSKPSPTSFAQDIRNLRKAVYNIAKTDQQAALSTLEEWIDQLPVPNPKAPHDLCQQLTESQVAQSLEEMYELMTIHAHLASLTPSFYTARQNSSLTMLAYMRALAIRHDKTLYGDKGVREDFSLADFSIDCTKSHRITFMDPFFVIYDPKTFERRKSLLAYLETANSQQRNRIGEFPEWETGDDLNPEPILLRELIRKDPLLEANFRKKAEETQTQLDVKMDSEIFAKVYSLSMLGAEYRASKSGGHVFKLRAAALMAIAVSQLGHLRLKHLPDDSLDAPILGSLGLKRFAGSSVYFTYYWKDTPFEAGRETLTAYAMHPSLQTIQEKMGKMAYVYRKQCLFPAISESYLLSQFKQSPHYPPILDTSNVEPSVQLSQILRHYSDHLSDFANSEMQAHAQTLFDLLFFGLREARDPSEPNKIPSEEETLYNEQTTNARWVYNNQRLENLFVPLFAELSTNSALQDQCIDFIQKGLSFYYHQQPKQRPIVPVCLFFVRLSNHLQTICPTMALPDGRDRLRSWLSLKSLTPQERSQIHQHLLLQYRGRSPLKMNDEEIQEMVGSWFYYTQHPIGPVFESFHLQESARHTMYSASHDLELRLKDQNTRSALCNHIVQLFGRDPAQTPWETAPEHPCYKQTTANGDVLQINLLKGQIADQTGIYLSGDTTDPTQTVDYERVFGTNRFPMQRTPQGFAFHAPAYGSIRILQKPDKSYVIQRELGGVWHEYIPPGKILALSSTLPHSLIADHSHWTSLTEGSERTLVISPLANPSQCTAMMNVTGCQLQKNLQLVAPETYELPLNRFEQSQWWHILSRDGSSIHSIDLPRYQSETGKPLSFVKVEGRYAWAENLAFLLDCAPQGLIGTVPNYLLLSHKTSGAQKILVPMQPIQCNQQSINRSVGVDVIDEHRKNEYEKTGQKSGILCPQNNQYLFLEYNVEGTSIAPINTEGSLYYSYLLLAQKNYAGAKKLLEQIPEGETLSASSLRIIKMCLELPELNSDNSPSAIAIRLYAFRLYANVAVQPQTPTLPDPPKRQAIVQLFNAYANGINHVPPSLRLTNQDLESVRTYAKHSLSIPVSFTPFQEVKPQPIPNPIAWLEAPLKPQSFSSYWGWETRSKISRMTPPHDTSRATLLDYFGALYEKARTLKTEEDRLQFNTMLHFALQLPKNDNLSEKQALLAFLHMAYLYPAKMPSLPQGEEQKWLEAMRKTYESLQTRKLPPERKPISTQITPSPTQSPIAEPLTNRLPLAKTPANIPARTLTLPPIAPHAMHLDQVAANYFRPNSSNSTLKEAMRFDATSSDPDALFDAAIQAELSEFQRDFEAGAQKSAERQSHSLKNKRSLPALQKTLRSKIEERQKAVDKLSREIETIVQKKAKSPNIQLQEELLHRGQYLDFPSKTQLIMLFLQGDASKYGTVNPHLTSADVEKLDQLLFAYLVANTELTGAKKALSQVDALSKLPPSQDTSLLENQLHQTLSAKMHYLPHTERALLVFEEQSGMRLRKPQVELLSKMIQRKLSGPNDRDVVAQLMMGGGKTTVIASILLQLSAKQGKIPLFFAPPAQFESLRANVSLAQGKHFAQPVVPLDLPRNLMTAENLSWMQNTLESIIQNGSVLLMKAETLQFIQLELLSCLYKRAHAAHQERIPPALDTKITTLKTILNLFVQKTDVLFDEVDVLLAPQRIANVPVGEMTLLNSTYVELMQTIAKLHIDESLLVTLPDGKRISVNDLLHLRDKEKPTLDTTLYTQTIQPVIAKALFQSLHKKWNLDTSFTNSFERYVLGQMQKNHLSEDDKRFLQAFNQLGNSTNLSEKETADQIALSRLFFQSVLPFVLTNSVNRNVGRTRSAPFGKVVPFLGADTPATTEFASPWEAGFNHYLTAFHSAIQPNQIKALSDHYFTAIEHRTRKTKQRIDETPEAKAFFALTNVPLMEIDLPGNMEKATSFVNQDIERVIQVETETIGNIVGYYTKYLSSNAQNLVAQVQGARRALSGTPFNIPTYPTSMQKDPALDVGVEGEIAHALLQRKCPIHSIPSNDIATILTTALKNGTPRDRLRGFVDTASLLKNFANVEVAEQILSFYKTDPTIDAVLFFGRKKPTDLTADYLMVLKKGATKPEFIGSTRADVLAKFGINPQRTFIYFDERHCEATDLPQKPDAINLLSIDSTLPRRTFSQGTLRLRQFFEGQTIACVVHTEERKKMHNQAETMRDALVSMCRNQAVGKAKETHRSLTHKIDHVPRQTAIDALLSAQDPAESAELFSHYESFLVSTQEMNPYKLYGALQELMPTGQSLEAQVKTVQDRIPLIAHERARKLMGHIPSALQPILQESAKQPYLPKAILQGAHQATGLAMQVQQEVQIEVEVELETELQQELQRYGALGSGHSYTETSWTDRDITKHTFPFKCPTKVYPLPKLFEQFDYAMPYGEIFDRDLLVSENLALTDIEPLSVFNKKQKPAANLLVWMKDNKPHFLLISIRETAIFKQYILKTKTKDMWLVLSDGHEQLSTPKHASLNTQQQAALNRALLQMNLFNGNAKYLDLHEERTIDFLRTKNRALVNRFLKLKVEKDPQNKKVFYRSAVLNPGHSNL